MLPPHELKNKSFTKTMRGYNPIEVDEYIDFLIEKYTELYRENDELERKLKIAVTRLDEVKSDEDSIRSALVDAKRAANKIKADAEDRAEAIVRAAKASCNTILADFNEKIILGQDTITELRLDALRLKQELFEKYSEHIRYIEALSANIDAIEVPDVSEVNRQALDSLKAGIFDMYKDKSENAAPIKSGDEEFDSLPDDTGATREFDITPDFAEISRGEALSVERTALTDTTRKPGIKEQALELGKAYKDENTDVINTPDSDTADDRAYMDFIRSVNGKKNSEPTAKDADFDMLFNNDKRRK